MVLEDGKNEGRRSELVSEGVMKVRNTHICISSPIWGLARKNRVGTTLESESEEKDATSQLAVEGRPGAKKEEEREQKYSPEISVLVDESSELLEDLGVHGVGHHVGVGDGLSVLLSKISLDLLEVERSHGESRSLVDGSSISARIGEETRRSVSERNERRRKK